MTEIPVGTKPLGLADVRFFEGVPRSVYMTACDHRIRYSGHCVKCWVDWFCSEFGCEPGDDVTRIEFRYLGEDV